MERGVDAEHDLLVADGIVGVGDLDTHGGSGGLKPDIVVFFCHGDCRIDINTMGMSHMDHDDREVRVALSQKSDLPRKGEGRMTGMDK